MNVWGGLAVMTSAKDRYEQSRHGACCGTGIAVCSSLIEQVCTQYCNCNAGVEDLPGCKLACNILCKGQSDVIACLGTWWMETAPTYTRYLGT